VPRRRTLTFALVVLALALAACGGTKAGSNAAKAPKTVLPTLGVAASTPNSGRGWGLVKPSEVYNGGDPTGLVQHIHWSSWGGARAVGKGTGYYEAPGVDVAGSVPATATIVAFDLGKCDGKPAYNSVEWYYPEKGQQFTPGTYETTCNGVGYFPPQA
jgi:hypothetical protein